MMEIDKDWSHPVSTHLSYVPEGFVVECTLNTQPPFPTYIENEYALTNNACDPMLPYIAQGAAQEIEDAHVLI